MNVIELGKSRLFKQNGNPIEAAKRMVSAVQVFVGIRDVFGDRKLKWSPYSLLAVVAFAGSFVYTGPFSQTIYLIQVFPDKVRTFQALDCISATCIPFSKYIFMWSSRNRLKAIMEMSQEGLSVLPEESSGRNRMIQTLNTARGVSWLVILSQATTHIVYLVIPFVFTIFGSERYLPTVPGETFGLSPKYETPFYEATFVITCLATAFSAINQTGYIVLFVTLVAHTLGHFYVITENFNDIFGILTKHENPKKQNDELFTNSSRLIDEKLAFCVRHHQFLIRYHGKIRELYKAIFGAQFLMVITVLVTTLQTMNSWDFITTVLGGVTGVMPLTIYCFGGELMISAADDMSKAVYSCGWELMNVNKARAVYLMLCLCQRPLHLSAAGFATMNRQTFANVIQAVYKIYAVFN